MRSKLPGFLIVGIVIMFMTILCASSFVSASCISLKLAKTSYIPQETVQVEIDASTIKDIIASDIFLYKGNVRIPVNVFFTKVSNTKYFAWFDLLPGEGDYSLKVRGNCKEGFFVESLDFRVEPTIASKYESLKSLAKDKFSSMSIEELLFVTMALSHDEKVMEQATNAFVSRGDSCLNKNCSTFLNSLTLLAFKDGLIRQRMLDAIEASQNYVNKGAWRLYLNSTATQDCLLWINNESSNISLGAGGAGQYSIRLDFGNVTTETITLRVECNESVNGTLNYNYKQFSKNIRMGEGTILQQILDNKGCFAKDFSKVFVNCDKEASTYAVFALARTNKFDPNSTAHISAISWLNRNADSVEEKAVVYYLTHDSEALTWLLNSQTGSGWWPRNTSYTPDVRASSITTAVLKAYANNESPELLNSINKAEKWLLNYFGNASLKDKAIILGLAFAPSDIEPILAIWPGIIKTSSLESFNFILQNKGMHDLIINANLLNSTTEIVLNKGTTKNVKFDVPLLTTTDGRALIETLNLNYRTNISSKFFIYNVPTIIFTQKSIQEQVNGSVNASEEEINESEQEIIINETQEQTQNKTTEINQSLLALFRFVERNISKDASVGESFSVSVRLSNQMDKDLKNVRLSYTSTLILMGGSITVEPSYIEKLAKGETKTITIYFSPTRADNYQGEIEASAEYDGQEIKAVLPVRISVVGITIESKNCSEMGGKICAGAKENCTGNLTNSADSFSCCIPASACKKIGDKGTLVALIIIVVIIAILLIILMILKRKPKKEMKEFLEETSKVYEKRFQRPPNVSPLGPSLE